MNPLLDVMSPKARKIFYAVVSLAVPAWGIWAASNGDWHVAVPTLLGTAAAALAHANTNPQDPLALPTPSSPPASEDPQP